MKKGGKEEKIKKTLKIRREATMAMTSSDTKLVTILKDISAPFLSTFINNQDDNAMAMSRKISIK